MRRPTLPMRLMTVAAVLAVLAVPGSFLATAHASASTSVRLTPREYTIFHNWSAAQLAATATSLPTFVEPFSYGGVTYHATLVGKNPNSSTTGTTTTPVVIIPLKITLPDTGDIEDGSTMVSNTVNSPIFKNANYGTFIGTTDWTDALARGQFATYVKTHPAYHNLLGTPTIASTVSVKPPSGQAITTKANGYTFGQVNVNYIDSVVGPIAAQYGANVLPLFLSTNVFMTQGKPNQQGTNCCIGGYHSAESVGTTLQAYAVTIDNNLKMVQALFGTGDLFTADITATSHEIAEWQDDPFGNNAVPGSFSPHNNTCWNAALEVGDPLENPVVVQPIAGFSTYHAQEETYFSWYTLSKASLGLNGWFSSNGTFKTAPAKC